MKKEITIDLSKVPAEVYEYLFTLGVAALTSPVIPDYGTYVVLPQEEQQ